MPTPRKMAVPDGLSTNIFASVLALFRGNGLSSKKHLWWVLDEICNNVPWDAFLAVWILYDELISTDELSRKLEDGCETTVATLRPRFTWSYTSVFNLWHW